MTDQLIDIETAAGKAGVSLFRVIGFVGPLFVGAVWLTMQWLTVQGAAFGAVKTLADHGQQMDALAKKDVEIETQQTRMAEDIRMLRQVICASADPGIQRQCAQVREELKERK